ncbi:MAG: outer membrane protein TolC [Candidatus Azotimanducaceae bacterium]|jgi:outer membrane protein TolC
MKSVSKGATKTVLAIVIGALAADLSAATESIVTLTSAAPKQPMVFFFGAEREASRVNDYKYVSPAVAGSNDVTGSYGSTLDENMYVEQPLEALPSEVAQSDEVAAKATTTAVAKRPSRVRRFMSGIFDRSRNDDAADIALAVDEVSAVDVVIESPVFESSVSGESSADVTTNPEIEEFSQAVLVADDVIDVDAAAVGALTVAAATDDTLVDGNMIDEDVEETVAVEAFSEEAFREEALSNGSYSEETVTNETVSDENDVAIVDQSEDVGQQSDDSATDAADAAVMTAEIVAEKPGRVSRFMGAVTGIFHRSSDDEVADVASVVAKETGTEEVAIDNTVVEGFVEREILDSDQVTLGDNAETEGEPVADVLAGAEMTYDTLSDDGVTDEIADLEDQTAAYTITPPVVDVVDEPGRVRRMMGTVTGFFSASDDDDAASSGETDSSFDFAIPSSTRNTVTLTSLSLSLGDFVALVAQNNDRINYQRMEWEISRAGVNSAKSMYEPAVIATYRYTDSNTPNTTEEEFRRAFSPEFIEQNNAYSVGVEGMVPTGGQVKVSFTNRDLDNNIQPSPISGEESRSYVGLSFTQPLLKGAGGRSVVEAPITVAEKEQEIARQTYRLSLFESVSNAALAYWDLYLADETLALRLRSVAIVESVLEDERARNRLGRSSNVDVLTAESAVAERRVQMYAARQSMVQAKNRLKSFVVGLDDQENLKIDGDANLSLFVENPDRKAILIAAFNHRPEYLASLLRAQKEDVRIQFASNSRLPQLDLVASYGLNGLDRNLSSSWDDLNTREHETTYVGLEFKMMLLGDRKAKSELSAATYRKHQALLEVQAAEMSLHNSIDTALSNLLTAKLQVDELVSVSSTNERLLQVELARFEAGQSNSRDLLDLEERINQTLEIALQSKANLQKALIGISLADGTLLQQFSLE